MDDDAAGDCGSAYVFRRDDNGTPSDPSDDVWIEEAKLTASDAAAIDFFGRAVAVSGDRAVVGAYGGDGAAGDAGSAYVFRRDDGGTPSDPSDDVWVEEAKLTASDAAASDSFGFSVSVSGDRAVVGARENDDAGSRSGSAYVYRRDDSGTPSDPSDDVWVEEAKLTASDAAPDDLFGYSVSISGDRAVVGAHGNDDAGDSSGSAYVFRRDDGGTPSDLSDDVWVEEAKLTASDAAATDYFGVCVAISGDRAVVGASGNDDAGSGSGAAYVFSAAVHDPDDDGDGVPNSCDVCVGDDATGDTDGDGVCDSDDNCPSDPNKTEPGVCGCGVSDDDTDDDGVADCNDACPDTPPDTPVDASGCAVAVPALAPWGLTALTVVVLMCGAFRLRRRATATA